MKKEFFTHWSPEKIIAKVSEMPLPRARFFDVVVKADNKVSMEIVVPDDITYDQLCFFIGRKTKVTIETVE